MRRRQSGVSDARAAASRLCHRTPRRDRDHADNGCDRAVMKNVTQSVPAVLRVARTTRVPIRSSLVSRMRPCRFHRTTGRRRCITFSIHHSAVTPIGNWNSGSISHARIPLRLSWSAVPLLFTSRCGHTHRDCADIHVGSRFNSKTRRSSRVMFTLVSV